MQAVNRRGRKFTCSVRALLLLTPTHEVTGVLLLMAERENLEDVELPTI